MKITSRDIRQPVPARLCATWEKLNSRALGGCWGCGAKGNKVSVAGSTRMSAGGTAGVD